MATQIVSGHKLWLGGYDLSCRMSALAVNYGADMVDMTTLCDDTHTFAGGLKTVTMAHEGYFSGGDGDIDDVLFDSFALTEVPISIGPTDGSDGERAFMMNAALASYTPGASVGDAFAISVTAEATEAGLIRGTVMHNDTQTSTDVGTARQLGAVASGQSMYAALHVLSASGTLDVVIQSDDNAGMTSATDQITFSQATGISSQFSSAAGAITDDYWRVSFTIGGGTPSFNFVVVLGIL